MWFCSKDKDSHSILQNATFPPPTLFGLITVLALSTKLQQTPLISRQQQQQFLPPSQWKTCGQGVVLATQANFGRVLWGGFCAFENS